MTDQKPLPVAGYKPQSDENIALANEGKQLEERYLRWLDKLNAMPTAAVTQDGRAADGIDKRYVALARTNIEQGAMWAIRSIFQPRRVSLPEDAD